MIPYKSKVVHDEEYILISTLSDRKKSYPGKENNRGDDYIMILLYDEHLGDTIVSMNTDLSENIILESR